MMRHLGISARLCVGALLLATALPALPAGADMLIRLKDGRTIAVPVDPGDIESVTYGAPPEAEKTGRAQPASRAAAQIEADAESVRRSLDAERRAEEAAAAAEAAAEAARAAADEAKRQAAAARAARAAAEQLSRSRPAPAASRSHPQASSADASPARRQAGPARVLRVGPGEKYPVPSAAARDARNGDTVEIAAGDYPGDVAVWNAQNLTLRGVGGRARLDAQGKSAQGKAIWVIVGSDYTIENIEFTNCRVPDNNGAGIRLEGRNLTVRNSYFHRNQMGILTGHNPESDVVIEGSEFYRNVVDYEKTGSLGHNIYIGRVRSFTLRGSYSHGAAWGHNVKTRAAENRILYNRLEDGKDGSASYIVDIAEGGKAWLVGNVLEQGPDGDNWTIVSFAAERQNGGDRLALVNNTLVNNRSSGVFVQVHGSAAAILSNNILAGPGTPLKGPGEMTANLIARSVSAGLLGGLVGGDGVAPGSGPLANNFTAGTARFVAPGDFDFRLRADSPARERGVEPGLVHGWPARPDSEYVHPLGTADRPRQDRIDIGAYEFVAPRP